MVEEVVDHVDPKTEEIKHLKKELEDLKDKFVAVSTDRESFSDRLEVLSQSFTEAFNKAVINEAEVRRLNRLIASQKESTDVDSK